MCATLPHMCKLPDSIKKQRYSSYAPQSFIEAHIWKGFGSFHSLFCSNAQADLAVRPSSPLYISVYFLSFTTMCNYKSPIIEVSMTLLQQDNSKHRSSLFHWSSSQWVAQKPVGYFCARGNVTVSMQTSFYYSKLRSSICISWAIFRVTHSKVFN